MLQGNTYILHFARIYSLRPYRKINMLRIKDVDKWEGGAKMKLTKSFVKSRSSFGRRQSENKAHATRKIV